MKKTNTPPANRKELQASIREMRRLKLEQEAVIRNEIKEIKGLLSPARLAGEAFRSVLLGSGQGSDAPVMHQLVSQVIGFILPQGMLTKLSGKIGGALITRGVNQLLTNTIVNNREEIMSGVASAWEQLKKKFSRNGKLAADVETEEDAASK